MSQKRATTVFWLLRRQVIGASQASKVATSNENLALLFYYKSKKSTRLKVTWCVVGTLKKSTVVAKYASNGTLLFTKP